LETAQWFVISTRITPLATRACVRGISAFLRLCGWISSQTLPQLWDRPANQYFFWRHKSR
jgi:hypothetical protein